MQNPCRIHAESMQNHPPTPTRTRTRTRTRAHLLYGVPSVHSCSFPYRLRKIMEPLSKLMKCAKHVRAGFPPNQATPRSTTWRPRARAWASSVPVHRQPHRPCPHRPCPHHQVRPSKSRCGSSTWNSSRLGRLPMASSSAGSSLPHLRRAAVPRQLSPRPLALKAAVALQMSDSGSPTWQLSARGQVAMQSRMQLRAVHSGT